MSLNIYLKESDIPTNIKLINYNDKFFASVELKNDNITRNILRNIDKATYNSKDTFIGRDKSLGALNKNLLSTGCKTLINISSNPDKCFDVIECGQNALQVLLTMKNGNVLWKLPVIIIHETTVCDVNINNKHFTDTTSLAEYATNLMMGEYDE